MNFNLIIIPVILLFISNGIVHMLYAVKLKKKFPQYHNFFNSIVIVFLWILAGLLYPFIYSHYNPSFVFFQLLSVFFICILTPGLLFLILCYQLIKIKKNPEIRRRRTFEVFKEKFIHKNKSSFNQNSVQFKTDLYRKLLHLVPALIIILLWIFAVYIWDKIWNANKIWGINGEEFGKFLIITVGFSGILAFAVLDFVRLSYIFEKHNFFFLLPDKVLNLLGKSLKTNEMYEFTKPAAMVLAFLPIFFFPFGIFAAAALIATIGDAAASLIGLKYGKYNFPKNGNKTCIGYFSGFLASFILSILALCFFEPYLAFIKILIIAFGGACTFFLIDFVNLKIDDDILNPLCSGLIMFLLYILF